MNLNDDRRSTFAGNKDHHCTVKTLDPTRLISVYVGNLPLSIDDAELFQIFSNFNGIEDLYINKYTRGFENTFGFVRFSTIEEAERSIKELNGWPVNGRRLRVQKSKEALRMKTSKDNTNDLQRRRKLENIALIQPTNDDQWLLWKLRSLCQQHYSSDLSQSGQSATESESDSTTTEIEEVLSDVNNHENSFFDYFTDEGPQMLLQPDILDDFSDFGNRVTVDENTRSGGQDDEIVSMLSKMKKSSIHGNGHGYLDETNRTLHKAGMTTLNNSSARSKNENCQTGSIKSVFKPSVNQVSHANNQNNQLESHLKSVAAKLAQFKGQSSAPDPDPDPPSLSGVTSRYKVKVTDKPPFNKLTKGLVSLPKEVSHGTLYDVTDKETELQEEMLLTLKQLQRNLDQKDKSRTNTPSPLPALVPAVPYYMMGGLTPHQQALGYMARPPVSPRKGVNQYSEPLLPQPQNGHLHTMPLRSSPMQRQHTPVRHHELPLFSNTSVYVGGICHTPDQELINKFIKGKGRGLAQ